MLVVNIAGAFIRIKKVTYRKEGLYIKRHNDSSRNVFCSQLLLVLLSEKGLMLLQVQKRIS